MGISASGGSSLKFTVPSNSAANSSGSYFTNFSKDLSVQFDSGQQEFYMQWRQRFSPDYLSNVYTGGGGFTPDNASGYGGSTSGWFNDAQLNNISSGVGPGG